MSGRDRLAAILTLAALVCLVLGAWVAWGIGYALVVAGVALFVLGLLVGLSEPEPEGPQIAQLHPSRRPPA